MKNPVSGRELNVIHLDSLLVLVRPSTRTMDDALEDAAQRDVPTSAASKTMPNFVFIAFSFMLFNETPKPLI